MKLSIPIYQVDAFANKAFEGNPAAVCFLPSTLPDLSDQILQAIAAENNLSETAFVQPLNNNSTDDSFKTGNRFKLRWFTPEIEVPLCGHATLASAAALFECASNTAEELFFETLSGELAVQRCVTTTDKATNSLKLAMNLPLLAAVPAESISPDFSKDSALVAAAVGGGTEHLKTSSDGLVGLIEDIVYDPSLRYLVIVLKGKMTQMQFEAIKLDIKAMYAAHSHGKLVGVILTAAAGGAGCVEHDFYSRFFGPWAGIDEDPVTGSAHSVLGPYWAEKLGNTELKARQCSRRGGELEVSVDREAGRVVVSGGAVVVIRGELLLDV